MCDQGCEGWMKYITDFLGNVLGGIWWLFIGLFILGIVLNIFSNDPPANQQTKPTPYQQQMIEHERDQESYHPLYK